jgi:hypothetical protein
MGLQIQTILNARTNGEIDAAFVTMANERPDALLVAGDAFLVSQRAQLVTLTARDRDCSVRELVPAGGLMSYGSDLADLFHQTNVIRAAIASYCIATPIRIANDAMRTSNSWPNWLDRALFWRRSRLPVSSYDALGCWSVSKPMACFETAWPILVVNAC